MKRDIEYVTEARRRWDHKRPDGQRTLLREIFSRPGDFGEHEVCCHLPVQISGPNIGRLILYLPERGTECNKVFVYRIPIGEFEMDEATRLAEETRDHGFPSPRSRG